MTEIGFRTRRVERRIRILKLGSLALGLFLLGGVTGWVLHRQEVVPVAGAQPVSCITLAIFPRDFVPAPNQVTVNVLNGSHRVGIAGITAELLKGQKFKIGKVGNYDQAEVSNVAEIHYGPYGKDAALTVAAYVNNATMVVDERTDTTVDLIVGQGFDQVLTRAEADAKLSQPIASPSGPGC